MITGKVAVPCRKVILVYNEIGTNITYSVQGSCLLSYKKLKLSDTYSEYLGGSVVKRLIVKTVKNQEEVNAHTVLEV